MTLSSTASLLMPGNSIAATIANHGSRMAPYLVDKTTKPDLSVISQTTPRQVDQAMPTNVADQIRDMMIQSEKDAPGANPFSGIVIASKTGTAEHGTDPKKTPPHAWYVAFAPADNPQVAVAVLVESTDTARDEISGGGLAGPIAKRVMEAVLNQ